MIAVLKYSVLFDGLFNRILHSSRSNKRLVMMVADSFLLPVCLWASYALRLSEWWPEERMLAHWWLFPMVSIVGISAFLFVKIYRTVLRYIGSQAILQIAKGILMIAASILIAGFFATAPTIPRSIPMIFVLVSFAYVAGSRFAYRAWYHWVLHHYLPNETVVIYGAGGAGVQIASAIADSLEYRAVGFIDDDATLYGSTVHGLRVYSPSKLPKLIERYKISRVLLAIPNATKSERRRVLESISSFDVSVLTVPSTPDIVSGMVTMDQLLEVEIEDLLGRDIVPPDPELLATSIRGKNVLVTGAGGSIGSELCRQIIANDPAALVLFDASEFNLYTIEEELGGLIVRDNLPIRLVGILGSVTDRTRLDDVIIGWDIHTIYHAAAYKHVPIVERNVAAGVENNVFGTKTVCDAALCGNVERMVMISTDKAVRPTNVMGATKRLAELTVQDAARKAAARKCGTLFTMVRFGNVLGSSGSVVPLFRKQIAEGGPVTVTHADITRYFMTIEEAASLVIQAGSMAVGGDVFLLDMGKEVRIQQLAEQMIRLSGLEVRNDDNPDGDIEIIHTGLRPAEKLYEELLIGDNPRGTQHPRIMRTTENQPDADKLETCLKTLRAALARRDVDGARAILSDCVSGYEAKSRIVDHLYHAHKTTSVS
ncbi:MAG: polysaccharide biosynthesis protein [Cohaesibacteraceae bacterium]|nr:polysaccharide biosynthesis protein [Cohaesibacteraceae bacterium]